MKRKALIISVVAIIISLFSISYVFANNTMDNMANGVRNVVGGAENMIEDAGSAIGGAVQSGMNTVSNGAQNVGNATENTIGAMTDNGNDDYTATRTATTRTADAGTDGMSTTTYTWFIIGITAVAIGVLLWSYFRQKNNNDNIYIDSNNR